MPITVHLPTALRPFADRQPHVSLDGKTVGEVIASLTSRYGALKAHLLDAEGRVRNFVNLYLNDQDVRSLQGPQTPVKDGDTLLIVPAIAGGTETLSREEISRYSRHLIMPEVGMEGQKKLKAAKVLVVGVGGLGAPASLYLAAAGVGTLGLVDFDVVDDSNLQRQVLFSTDSVGRAKLEAAAARLRGLNPHVAIKTFETRLSAANALDIVKEFDIVLDGTDNFATRYLVNDACVLLGKANVYASIFRFEGQVSVFKADEGPCYRCLYPTPPPPGLMPSCAEGGVLGVLPEIVGAMQALEAIKLILGAGSPLLGQLALFDALSSTWRKLKQRKDPSCPICGPHPTLKGLTDYEALCGLPAGAVCEDKVPEISVEQLKSMVDAREPVVIVDVRERHEYEICRIQGARLMPLGELSGLLGMLDKEWKIVVHCKSGVRSAKAVKLLRENGFANAVNLAGGIMAWSDRIDREVPAY